MTHLFIKIKTLSLFTIAVLLIISCGTNNKSKSASNHLKPLNIDIPSELKKNKEAVNFIKSSEVAINNWSNTLEDLYQKTEKYANVPEEDLSMMDKISLIKIGAEFAVKMGEFSIKTAEIQSNTAAIENGLSDEEIAAFAIATKAFEARIIELDKKYENYGKSN